jgi:hypothetical protein
MKFFHVFLAEQVPEWTSEYIDYKQLKVTMTVSELTSKQQITLTKEKAVAMVKSFAETGPSISIAHLGRTENRQKKCAVVNRRFKNGRRNYVLEVT